MPAVAHPLLLVAGLVLMIIAIWLWRFSSRHAIDVKGAAISSGAAAMFSRKFPSVPKDIRDKYDHVARQDGHVGKAKAAGGIAVKAALAKLAFFLSLGSFLVALVLIVLAFWWK